MSAFEPIADFNGAEHYEAMVRYFSPFVALLVALLASPASAASGLLIGQPEFETGPPGDMIDFLGRRKECADVALQFDGPVSAPPPGSWREWLRCEAIAGEEQALRRRFVGDTRAIAFLDEAPTDFQLNRWSIVVNTYDGPPAGRVERAEQRGFDAGGRIAWRMVLDRQAVEGRTAVTVSWGDHPSRTIYLDDEMFSLLDLSSAWVAIREGPYESLSIEMRYGVIRGWCGDVDRDDRSRVSLSFKPSHTTVSRQDRTNCNGNYVEVEASAYAAPLPAIRR